MLAFLRPFATGFVPFCLLLVAACTKSTGSDAGMDPPPYGEACAEGCEELTCVDDARFPGGYCTSLCADAPCGEGAVCVDELGAPLCLAACTVPGDCRDGYDCWRGTCRPPCTGDPECGADATCDESTGTCSGAECVDEDDCPPMNDCLGGMCVPRVIEEDTGPPMGCDPATCDGVCVPDALGGGCRPRCERRLDCPGVDACVPIDVDDGTGRAETVCLPPNLEGGLLGTRCAGGDSQCDALTCISAQCTEPCTTDDDCILGQTCRDLETESLPWRGCGYAGVSGTLMEIDLGTHDVDEGSSTRRLTFATPPGSRSLTLIAERVSGDNLPLSFVTVVNPENAQIFDLNEIAMLVDQPVRWLPLDSEEVITMLIPNRPNTFRSGRHGVSVAALGDGGGSVRIRVRALVKRRNHDNIDLNVHIAPGLGFNAGSAPGNAQLQAAIARFSTIYDQAGIDVGDVNYFNVSGSRFTVIDSTDGPDSELADLFRQSSGRSGTALNVFLVRDIDGSGGGSTLGIAGGIPGPPDVHGTSHSGVVIAWGVLGGGDRIPGQVIAHETGHYLGLFHSTENGRPCGPGETRDCVPFEGGDPLPDTRYGDNRNMMFWALQTFGGGTVNDRMSDQQADVLQGAALVLHSSE